MCDSRQRDDLGCKPLVFEKGTTSSASHRTVRTDLTLGQEYRNKSLRDLELICICVFLCGKKDAADATLTAKEPFQGKKENLGSLSSPRNNPFFTLLMGIGDFSSNRDCIGHKRVTATASGDSSFPVGLLPHPTMLTNLTSAQHHSDYTPTVGEGLGPPALYDSQRFRLCAIYKQILSNR